MKPIYKIARTDLKQLFFSPIAWLILVIFTFQSAMVFTDIFEGIVRRQVLGWRINRPTLNTFAGSQGAFPIIQQYLYLYIPLLTMGVMSREFSSGSIKLLYSSPLTSRQMVFGKYLALVAYAGVLTAILAVFGGFAAATIKDADIPLILTGLLGLFLLTCAYAAVGLFMSSLTSYTVVSAMGTLGIFAVLSYVKTIGQEVEFVRDITYWLAISGRSDTFISGMITSEDVLYFIIVISLFLGFTVIKMQGARQRRARFVSFARYAMVFGGAMLLGYFSSKPQFMSYYDATATKVNTLTKGSQVVLKHLDEELTITTYTNMLEENHTIALPALYKWDIDRFKQYIRFKPEIKTKYVYYYEKTANKQLEKQYPGMNADQLIDTLVKLHDWKFDIVPYKDISKEVDLAPEGFRFVRHLKTASGKETFLRVYDDMTRLPNETEITAAFKRLVMDTLPTIGFLTGHGERKSDAEDERGYSKFAQEKSFRYSFINQGFDFEDISLHKEIPAHIRILLIAEVRKALTPEEMTHLHNYIDRGGNCIIAGEPGRLEFMNPIVEKLGVQFEPGILVRPSKKFQPNLLLLNPTRAAEEISFQFKSIRSREEVLPMPTVSPLSFRTDKGFSVTTLFASDSSRSWVEKETTNFVDDTVQLNPQAGEVEQAYPVALALSRKVKNKDQKIIVTGDADFLSNSELMMNRDDVRPANFNFISGAFFWLTNGELPADMRRPPTPDKELRLGKTSWAICKVFLKWGLPSMLMLWGLFIWIRRKRR